MDGVQLPEGQGHFEDVAYYLPISSQKFLVLILLASGLHICCIMTDQTFSQKLCTRALVALGGSPINKHFDKPTSIKLYSCKWPLPLTLESFLTSISVPPFTRFVVSILVVVRALPPPIPPHWSQYVVYEIGKHLVTSQGAVSTIPLHTLLPLSHTFIEKKWETLN